MKIEDIEDSATPASAAPKVVIKASKVEFVHQVRRIDEPFRDLSQDSFKPQSLKKEPILIQ